MTSPAAEASLDRPVPPREDERTGLLARGDMWLFGAVAVLVVVAMGMRFVELGERAAHHDESLHALFSYRFAEGKGYQHDPLMHGPLQFHAIAPVLKLFGASDATVRIPAPVPRCRAQELQRGCKAHRGRLLRERHPRRLDLRYRAPLPSRS